MKEITRIITAEITVIAKEGEVEQLKSKEETKKTFESFIRDYCDADDCKVTNIQDFEMDKQEG